VFLFLAPWIAQAMRQPDSVNVLRALSVVCLVNALATVSQNLLRRELNFKAVYVGQMVSFALAYFVFGIGLAMTGFGVWALVAAVIGQSVIACLWMLNATRHPMALLFKHPQGGSDLMRFGGNALLVNLLNWSLGNLDRFLVGRAFSGHGLGLYNTTYNLILVPTTQIVGILQSILFPASARAQADMVMLAVMARAGLNIGALITVPTFVAVSMFAAPIMNILYGTAWMGAAPVLAALSIAMIPYCLMGILTPLIWGAGKVALEGKVQALCLVLFLGLAYAASLISLAAVAWSVAIAFSFRFIGIVFVFGKAFDVKFWQLLAELRGGVVVGAIGAAAVLAADFSLDMMRWAAWASLGAAVVISCTVVLVALALLPWLVSYSGAQLALRMLPAKLPGGLKIKQRLAAKCAPSA
jgi:O-antigen/teichoic acid export membrane protein